MCYSRNYLCITKSVDALIRTWNEMYLFENKSKKTIVQAGLRAFVILETLTLKLKPSPWSLFWQRFEEAQYLARCLRALDILAWSYKYEHVKLAPSRVQGCFQAPSLLLYYYCIFLWRCCVSFIHVDGIGFALTVLIFSMTHLSRTVLLFSPLLFLSSLSRVNCVSPPLRA